MPTMGADMLSAVLVALLGGGATATIILGVYDRVRNRTFDKVKQDSTIKLDDATYAEIQSRSEQTTASSLIAVGSFWQGQFTELSKRFEAEHNWRKRMQAQAHEHQLWDQKLLDALRDCDMLDVPNRIGPPPSLDPDE